MTLTPRMVDTKRVVWIVCAIMVMSSTAHAQIAPPTASPALPPAAAAAGGWIFTSFRGSGDGLHLGYSLEGREWTDLRRTFIKPAVGSKLMRDPHLLLGQDGLFHLFWTTGWNDLGIGHATSKDLISWGPQEFLPLMEKVEGAKCTWAPEVYYDEASGGYVIVWSSNVNGQYRAWVSVTKDFKTFSPPKVLFDPGFGNIDATIVKNGGKWRMAFKQTDDQEKKVWGAVWAAEAESLLGPWKVMDKPVLEKQRVEGPALVQVGDNTLLYVDHYTDHKYSVLETTDWQAWKDVTNSTGVIDGQRHGSILPVTVDVMAKLRHTEREYVATVPRPILDGYTADPSIRVFGDTYYLYPTSDKPHWMTTDFSVWSSKNLVDWKRERMILDVTKELSWANTRAWAPDCIERDGKYYFYFCGNTKIGVAVGDSPLGPFKDAIGKPLVQAGGKVTMSQAIDPQAFIDDDGQAYLYYGNGTCQVVKLKRDMITVDGDPVSIPLKDFREAVWVFKRGGKYYFTWSIDDARSPNYRVGWGISDSPTGPVKTGDKNFIVLQKNGNAVATAHHSVVNVPGTDRWYVAYHRHAVPGGNGYKRETCLVRMEFDDEGRIKPMDPLSVPFPMGSRGEPIVNGKGLPEVKDVVAEKPFHAWAPTPPMGWNSWDCFGTAVTEAQVKENADFMAEKLAKFGWNLITVDIQWYEGAALGHVYTPGARLAMDGHGRLLPALNKFPSATGENGFKPLGDYIHSKGLKFGVHLMRGIPRQAVEMKLPIVGTPYTAADIANTVDTCSWNPDMYGVDMSKPGAQAYYDSVYKLLSEWGVDFVKVDDLSRPYFDHQAEIEGIRKAIDKAAKETGRPMVLSTSPGETPVGAALHVAENANLWRMSDDFWDRWPLLKEQFARCAKWAPYLGKGHYPDADMLALGAIRVGQKDPWTRFTKDEQVTHVTLWSIVRSPLIFGGNLPQCDEWTLSLLTNEEVLAVNQRGANPREISNEDGLIVWASDAPDGGKYVATFNTRDEGDASVEVELSKHGLPGDATVRDLWERKDLEKTSKLLTAKVAPHGAKLFHLAPATSGRDKDRPPR